ncbi:MAG: SAM-dependent methyltransferase [Planctomycetota bacterium]|nr:MAG: SAM-dependent methyltransferase [Planctomycetota bacterium]
MSQDSCQSCSSTQLRRFFELDAIPVHSCLLMESREEARNIARRDLVLDFCEDCGFVQNTVFDSSVHRYSPQYEETQAYSSTFNAFAEDLARQWIERYQIYGKRVLEIGCGKGEFLVKICELGDNEGIGIDPGYRPERTHTKANVRFLSEFYCENHGDFDADVILCRHSLEHIAPVRELMQTIRRSIGKRETIVLFELPAIERVLEGLAFEDVYYEHCSYFSLGSLARLFRDTGFRVLRLASVYDDQYLLIEADTRSNAKAPPLPEEKDLPRLRAGVQHFQKQAPGRIAELAATVRAASAQGEKTVLWGSGSKAVAFLTATGLDEEIEFGIDINPHKHGRFIPGSGQEVKGPEFLQEDVPERVLVMNRIYLPEIGAQLKSMGLSPKLEAL